MTQRQQQVKRSDLPVRRMDEVAQEQEAAEHEEILSRSRRASKRAQRVTQSARALLFELHALGV